MSIYSRSYMRDEPRSPGGGGSFDALKVILITLLGVFVLQRILVLRYGGDVLSATFGIMPEMLLRGQVHRLLTYSLLHDTASVIPIHLIFNGLVIFFAGREVQRRLGPTRLLELFLFSALLAGLGWSVIQFLIGHDPLLVGASGAAMGLITVFALLYWNERISLIFIVFPITLEGKKIFYFLLGFQAFLFLISELPQGSPGRVAYSAHLAGIGAGYLYGRFLIGRATLWDTLFRRKATDRRPPPWQPRAEASKKVTGRFKLNFKAPAKPKISAADADLRAEVDRILDKINERGFGALSDEEKRTLDRAKDKLK